jgi:hypothetical protein
LITHSGLIAADFHMFDLTEATAAQALAGKSNFRHAWFSLAL